MWAGHHDERLHPRDPPAPRRLEPTLFDPALAIEDASLARDTTP